MHSIEPPTFTADEAYTRAVGSIRSAGKRATYTDARSAVLARCTEFDALAKECNLHLAVSADFEVEGIDNSQMVALYDDQFSRRAGTKAMRDSIKNSAPLRLCPYCGDGYVDELDHYLPKTRFAGVTVHPANLVPTCNDCNFAKKAYKPGPNDPAVLHPYFDYAFDTPWLVASIELGPLGNPVMSFDVDLAVRDLDLEKRLRQHLNIFQLHRRFGVWAAQAIENFELLLNSGSVEAMTLDQARQYLQRNAVGLSGGRANTWERATYSAMANSDWYLRSHLLLT